MHKRETGFSRNYEDHASFPSRPFPSSRWLLYQNEVKSAAFDMKMIFNSLTKKTYFHRKGCTLGLILKVRVFGTLKSACSDTASVGLSCWHYLLQIVLGCKRTHTAFREGLGD